MKRTLFIIGIIIILILAGILLFLLLASDDQKRDVFSAFNFGDTTDTSVIDAVVDLITPTDDRLAALRQLTLKPVIGMNELLPSASSTATLVLYGEAGTGHIFSLDVVSGTENRLSNITIPAANEVTLSATGDRALVLSGGRSDGRELTLVTLPGPERELSSFTFTERAKQATLTNDKKVLYTTVAGNTLIAREYTIATNETRTLFTLPFKEATVRFPKVSTGPVYAYPKTAEFLESYVYEIREGVVRRLPFSGYALTAIGEQNMLLVTSYRGGIYESSLYDSARNQRQLLPFIAIAEKCSFVGDANTLYCGIFSDTKDDTPLKWYQGILTTSDELFRINEFGEMISLVNLKNTSSRDIDVTHLTGSADASRLYFINKIDGTLWIFDQAIAAEETGL